MTKGIVNVMYESPYSDKKQYLHHTHIRFLAPDCAIESKLHDASIRASREIISLFPLSKIELDPSNIIDFTSYPFDDKSGSQIMVIDDNQKDVYQSRGFMCGMPIPTKECHKVSKNDVLAKVYNEQFVFKLRISSHAKTQKQEDEVASLIKHVISNMDYEGVSLLSLQREIVSNVDGIGLCHLGEYIPENSNTNTVYPIRGIDKVLPSMLSLEDSGFFDQDPSVARAVFEDWENSANELEQARLICHTQKQETPIYCKALVIEAGSMIFNTLAKVDANINFTKVIGFDLKNPLWKITEINSENGNVFEVSRLIEIPVSPNIECAIKSALSYPLSTKFGDRYGYEYNICLSLSHIGKASELFTLGLILEREITEDGEVYFSFVLLDDNENETIIFECSEFKIADYFHALNAHEDEELTVSSAQEVSSDMSYTSARYKNVSCNLKN